MEENCRLAELEGKPLAVFEREREREKGTLSFYAKIRFVKYESTVAIPHSRGQDDQNAASHSEEEDDLVAAGE